MENIDFDNTLRKLYRDAKQLKLKVVTIEFLMLTFISLADPRLYEILALNHVDLVRFKSWFRSHLVRNSKRLDASEPVSVIDLSSGLSTVLNWSRTVVANTFLPTIDAGVVMLMVLAWGDGHPGVKVKDKPDFFAYCIFKELQIDKDVVINYMAKWFVAREEGDAEAEAIIREDLTNMYNLAKQGIWAKCRADRQDGGGDGDRNRPQRYPRSQEDRDEKKDQGDSEAQVKFEDFTVNLNEKALESHEPLIGRTREIDRCIQVLCKKRKNNPLFIGEPGVGKTALAEGLARRVVAGDVPDKLKESIIYSLQITDVLAGTKYRGDFEERMKVIIKSISEQPNAILFVDEIHTLIGAGATTNSTLDASNMMKPALANGTLRCIGATTYSEYKKYFEKDKALSRRFHTIDVPEPSVEETVKILNGLKDIYETFHNVSYSPEAIKTAASLSAKYITDRFLPDKAIDILDEVGAKAQTPDSKNLAGPLKITKSHIENIISTIARVPLSSVTQTEKDKLMNLESVLKGRIFGQDDAIGQIVDTIKLSKSGLSDPDKPMGSFLFAGPTGVGKTELCKQMAEQLGLKLLRFDMSEYSDSISVTKLIGVAPGYVGFEQLGLLTDQVQNNPHSVLLLDELEKAHQDIFNVLLQVLDYGTLTDNNGRKVDFRHVIVVMTTNVGAEAMDARSMGFSASDEDVKDCDEAVRKFFSPEFRNRIDHIVMFKPLSRETVRGIVLKMLEELRDLVKEKRISLTFTSELVDHLIEKGHDPKMGARPLKRLIKKEILSKLSDEILFGRLIKGGDAIVDVDGDDAVTLRFDKAPRGGGSIRLEPPGSDGAAGSDDSKAKPATRKRGRRKKATESES